MGAEILTAAFLRGCRDLGGLGSFWGVIVAAMLACGRRQRGYDLLQSVLRRSLEVPLMALVLLLCARLPGERIEKFEYADAKRFFRRSSSPLQGWPLSAMVLDFAGLPLRSSIDVVVFAIACRGLNILVGNTGLVSFGQEPGRAWLLCGGLEPTLLVPRGRHTRLHCSRLPSSPSLPPLGRAHPAPSRRVFLFVDVGPSPHCCSPSPIVGPTSPAVKAGSAESCAPRAWRQPRA